MMLLDTSWQGILSGLGLMGLLLWVMHFFRRYVCAERMPEGSGPVSPPVEPQQAQAEEIAATRAEIAAAGEQAVQAAQKAPLPPLSESGSLPEVDALEAALRGQKTSTPESR